MKRWLTRVLLPILFLALVLVGILVLTYVSGTLGLFTQQAGTRLRAMPTANPPPLPGTPIARFEQVNPAVVNEFNQFQSGYRPAESDAFGVSVAPVGAYLPRSGNRQFALVDPTPLPTLFPYPTSPPLPNPPIPGDPLFTPVPGSDGEAPQIILINSDCAPSGLPAEGIFTQRYHRYHLGLDIGVPRGTPVLSTQSGVVLYADWSVDGYGNLVIVQSGAFITYYAHNTSFNVAAGQVVSKGNVLAFSGSTGNSTGPHIHYETRINDIPVDPQTFGNRGYFSC